MTKRSLSLAALVGLALLTAVLVVASLRGGGSTETEPAAVSAPPSTVPSSTTPSAAPTKGVGSAVPTVGLYAADKNAAWRYTAGTCAEGGAKLEHTTDGGSTWQPAKVGLKQITGVTVSGGKVTVTGADDSCKPAQTTSKDDGGSFSDVAPIEKAWAVTPDATQVVKPGGGEAKACGDKHVLQLVRLSNDAAQVLCEGGVVASSTDGGGTWKNGQTLAGALAMDAAQQPIGVVTQFVLPGTGDCTGLQVAQAEGAGQASPLGCIALDPASVKPGSVALSTLSKGGWLRVGDKTYVSDDLATWKEITSATATSQPSSEPTSSAPTSSDAPSGPNGAATSTGTRGSNSLGTNGGSGRSTFGGTGRTSSGSSQSGGSQSGSNQSGSGSLSSATRTP